MAAATQDRRKTQRKYLERMLADGALLAASTTLFNGTIVAADASGNLKPAADTAALTVLGVAGRKMINSAGVAGHPTNGPKASLQAGVFKFATTGANAITVADVGKNCYALDDQTVVRAAGTTNSILVGVVEGMADDGDVWVKVNC